MPIVINTTEQSYESRMTHSSIPLWLQQSLSRFMSNNKGRRCNNSQYLVAHDTSKTLCNTLVPREGNLAVIISASQHVIRSAYEKMQKNLEHVRLKWVIVSRGGQYENPDLIMLNAQCNLIGLSTIVSSDKHSNDRSIIRIDIADIALQEPKDLLQEISDRSASIVYADFFPEAGTNHLMNVPRMGKSLDLMHANTHDHQESSRKKNYRYTDFFHCFQSNKDCAGNPSFYHTLYAHCGTIAGILNDLHVAFRHYIESVAHSWEQFMRFLGHTSFRGGDVIYLLSRTTMRRVKFLYEKPPTTLTV